MPSNDPAHPVRLVTSRQTWRAVTFLHWAYPAATIQRRLPRGLEVDVLDGSAWVGVTPLVMRDVRASVLPPAPGWSTFAEVNVRTYVRHPASGTDGLWFFTLLCPRAVMVGAMRAVGLPYHRFPVTAERSGSMVTYRGQHPGHGRIDLAVLPGERVESPSRWLTAVTGRWNAYVDRAGRLWRVPVAHPPWPLHRATVVGTAPATGIEVNGIVTGAGLPAPAAGPVVTWSPGVETRVGVPRLLRPR
ncbi:YqjF family protein [Isoptericola sp. NPDC057391]|uniref:YqjF family protein n=1 Tax=Isoptericola sp. NPDC057391 TaxID=3346117 RepID=UPI00362B7DAA